LSGQEFFRATYFLFGQILRTIEDPKLTSVFVSVFI